MSEKSGHSMSSSDTIKSICHRVMDQRLFLSKKQHGCAIYLCQNGGSPPGANFISIQINQFMRYSAFCDDFGPLNALSIMRFIENLDKEIAQTASKDLVCHVGNSRRAFTNLCFLLGAYMILKLRMQPDEVWNRFSGLDDSLFEPYRDATYETADFELRLIDCWQGLKRGVDLGWFAMPSTTCAGWTKWGRIYKDEYSHFDNPYNGDLHEVAPGKFIAFKGPRDLELGAKFVNNKADGIRIFSPAYYADAFRVLGVSTVVRLNHAQYDATAFTAAGMRHHDLFFEDCSAPPRAVIARFFKLVDDAPGLVAVHCSSGLGRTGTLIALYMMRSYGFTARAAMGWLRVMRPGSVIGGQQQFLASLEEAGRKAVADSAAAPSPTSSTRSHADTAVLPSSPPATASLSSAAAADAAAAADIAAAVASAEPPKAPKGCLRRPSMEYTGAAAPGGGGPGARRGSVEGAKVRRRASVEWGPDVIAGGGLPVVASAPATAQRRDKPAAAGKGRRRPG